MNKSIRRYTEAKGLALIALALLFSFVCRSQTNTVIASFAGTTAPGWVFGGTINVTNPFSPFLTASNGIDSDGSGWLRLTDIGFNEAVYARYADPIASTNAYVYASFDLASWNSAGVGAADGVTFFLADASQPFAVGSYGGSLGYAQRTDAGGVPGMRGGYLGIGFDEYGNYSNPTEGRFGGPGSRPGAIVVRGPGTNLVGYAFISGTGDGFNPTLPTSFNFPNRSSRPTSTSDLRHIQLVLSPQNILTVYIQYGTNQLKTYFVSDLSSYRRPKSLYFGYTASTGSGASYHEIRNFKIVSYPASLWDNEYVDGVWGNVAYPNNWNPDAVPASGGDILLNNAYVSSRQVIDLTNQAVTVRSISFDAPFDYTLTNGVIVFATNNLVQGHPEINLTDVNGTGNAVIAANVTLTDQIGVNNASAGILYLKGNITNAGYATTVAGGGLTVLEGQMLGSGTVYILPSTLKLGSSDRLGDGVTVEITGGTLGLSGASEVVKSLQYNQGTIDFGTDSNTNAFLFRDGLSSSNGLTIVNWRPGDVLGFSNSLSSLFLTGVYFEGYGPTATVLSNQTVAGYPGTWHIILPSTNSGYFTWDGGASGSQANRNNWSYGNGDNWVNDANPTANGGNTTNRLSFEGTVRLSPNLDGNYVENTIRFNTNAGSFTLRSLTGSTLTLDGVLPSVIQLSTASQLLESSMNLVINQRTILDTAGSGTLTIESPISGLGGLTKLSAGNLVLDANNSYTGHNDFQAGTVVLRDGNALGSGAMGTTIQTNATVELTNNITVPATHTFLVNGFGKNGTGALLNSGGSNSIAAEVILQTDSRIASDGGLLVLKGAVEGSAANLYVSASKGQVIFSNAIAIGVGGLTKTGTNTVTLAGNSDPNTYIGLTTVADGVLALGKASGLNAIAGNIHIGDGTGTDTLRLLNSHQINDTSIITLSNSGVFELNGFSETMGGLSSSGSHARIALGLGTLTVSNVLNSSFAGVISGAGSLVVNGAGIFELAGLSNNAWVGNTIVSGGTLALNKTGAVAISNGTLFVTNSGTLLLNNNHQIADNVGLVFGGRIILNGHSEIVGSLKLLDNSTIDFGSNATNTIQFAASDIANWNGKTLFVTNWAGDGGFGSDVLRFGINSSGVGAFGPELTQIQFVNPNGSGITVGGYILPNGIVIPASLVNHAPSFTVGANLTVLEDSGSLQATNWATNISAGPWYEATQTVSFFVSVTNASLFADQPAMSSSGTLSLAPSANLFGTAFLSIVAIDNGGINNTGTNASAPQMVSVTVLPVNDAPTLNPIVNVSIRENSGAQTVTLTGISAGPANEAVQSLEVSASSSNAGLIPTPLINYTSPNSIATLTFTPVSNATGTATITVTVSDDGGTANGGANSFTRTFMVTVNPINHQPTLDSIPNLTIAQDSGVHRLSLTGISTGSGAESGQQITAIQAASSNPALIPNLDLSYVSGQTTAELSLAATNHAFGTASITVTVQDNGGTLNGGVDTIVRTFTITVLPNQAPAFIPGADPVVLEDAGQVTVTNWATGISSGAGETRQHTVFHITNDAAGLFSVQPVISPEGTLSFTPAPDAYGAAIVTAVIEDDGAISGGGENKATNQFSISILPVNDAPTFVTGVNLAIYQNSGPANLPNWASSISTGPANEAGQTVTFYLQAADTNLFTVQPQLSSEGALTFTPAPGAQGSTIVTVRAQDNGGIANGGTDTSAASTFCIRFGSPAIQAATGGSSISVDTIGGAWTPLTGPVYREGGSGDVGAGTLILNAPEGYEFDTGGITPSLLIERIWGEGPDASNINGLASGTSIPVSSVTATQITVTITRSSASGVVGALTWQDIRVRPISGDLPWGSITAMGTAALQGVISGTTDFGALRSVPGSATRLVVQTQPSAVVFPGQVFTQQPVIAVVDQFGNVAVTDSTTTVSAVSGVSGTNILGGTLTVSVVNGIAQFIDLSCIQVNEHVRISFVGNGLAPVISDQVTVVAGPARSLVFIQQPTLETAGKPFTKQPILQTVDEVGNFTTNLPPSLPLSIQLYSGEGILSGIKILDIGSAYGNGTVAFTDLEINTAGQNKRLRVDGSGLTAAISAVFTVTNPAPASPFSDGSRVYSAAGPIGLWLADLRGNKFSWYNPGIGLLWRDLVVAHFESNIITVQVCNDDGTFKAPVIYPAGLCPFAVRSGFFSDYTFEDVIVANYGTNTISLYQNSHDGKCTLSGPIDFVTGTTPNPGPISVSHAWVSGSRYADVFVANSNESSVSVFVNNDKGGFRTATHYPVGRHPMFVAVCDFDADEHEDILTANKDDGTLTILKGQAHASFVPFKTIRMTADPAGDPQPYCAVGGDLNGDGMKDIVVANCNSNTVSVLLQTADGNFEISTNYDVGSNPQYLLLRDLNRDAVLDFVVANYGSASIDVFFGRGDGTFEFSGRVPAGDKPMCVVGSNFNNDRATDLAVSNFGDSTVRLFLFSGPLAENKSVSTLQDTPVSIELSGSIAGGQKLKFGVTGAPKYGALSGTPPNITYTPAPGFFGTDTFEYRSYDTNYAGPDSFQYSSDTNGFGASCSSAAAIVSITVNPVNAAPSFNLSTNLVFADVGIAQEIRNFATNLYAGTTNLQWQNLKFVLTVTNLDFFSKRPELGTDGILSFTADYDAVGTNYVTARLQNGGGNAHGGTNSSEQLVFGIAVASNIAPAFVLATNVLTASAETGVATISNFAKQIVVGPASEYWQSPRFVLSVTNADFFAKAPSISPNGNLTFALAKNATGTNHVQVQLFDDGPVGAGGTNGSVATRFAVIVHKTVGPSFTLATNRLAMLRVGFSEIVSNFACNISAGTGSRSASFALAVTNRALFRKLPTIDTNGTLSFTLAPTAAGTNYVSVCLKGNEGMRVISASQVFAIAVPNPFNTLKQGVYSALFYRENDVEIRSSGLLTFQFTGSGSLSGKVFVRGSSYAFKGASDFLGNVAPIQVLRELTNRPLVLNLNVDVSGADRVYGTISDGVWTALVQGDRNVFDVKTRIAPQAGTYTLAIPGHEFAESNPAGDGYGKLTIGANGKIVFSGKAADGSTLSQTTYLSKDGQWPLYVPLHKGRGMLLGWVQLDAVSGIGGIVTWMREPIQNTIYSSGFTNEIEVIGSRYTVPSPGSACIDLDQGVLSLRGGNLVSLIQQAVYVQTNNVVLTDSSNTNAWSLKVGTNGLFTGKFTHPVTRKTTALSGVVLQQQRQARGYFMGATQSGSVLLNGN